MPTEKNGWKHKKEESNFDAYFALGLFLLIFLAGGALTALN